MQQFAAVCDPNRADTNISAVLKELSGGQTPNRVICCGHSLGGALATLGQSPTLCCCAVLRCAVLTLCSGMLCCAVLCCAVLCCAVLCLMFNNCKPSPMIACDLRCCLGCIGVP